MGRGPAAALTKTGSISLLVVQRQLRKKRGVASKNRRACFLRRWLQLLVKAPLSGIVEFRGHTELAFDGCQTTLACRSVSRVEQIGKLLAETDNCG